MENIQPWFALKSVPGIGNHLFKRLLERFGSPEAVFQAPAASLLQIQGMTVRLVDVLKRHRLPDALGQDLERVARGPYRIVTFGDDDYPPLLREIADPPPFLYVHGRLDAARPHIAVVGSRHATDYGMSTTRKICRDLAALGITVVSGMAKGIDTAAHTGALQGKGDTVAVLGSGLEKIYPAENRSLCSQIARQGAVVSEFPLDADPDAHHFPSRNRIISGMSFGVLVVEATRKSGSLITARLAAEQNREVFAIPGSIRSFKSTGTHNLIKQGAKLVEHARDILEEVPAWMSPPADSAPRAPKRSGDRLPPMSETEARVYAALEPYSVHVDELVRKTALAPGALLSVLLALELKGLVRQSPGKRFAADEPQKTD